MRILAIFMIAAGALLCGLPPLFMRAFQSADSTAARVARAFSGGIILALALIHIVPEAVMELSEVVDFPIGGVTVLAGILALVAVDSTLTALWAPEGYKRALRAAAAAADSAAAKANGGGGGASSLKAVAPGCGHHHHKQQQHEGHGHDHDHSNHANHAAAGAAAPASKDVAAALDAAASQPPAPHTHACTSSLSAQRWAALDGAAGAAGEALDGARRRVTAYTMELGCIFHSVVIGVGVGVITGDRQLVVVLMIALIVHQGLEGLSLGTVLALTPFSRLKKALMVAAYALTTSVGIAIGIAVSATYDPHSVASKAVQGTLNGVSGGMLLYISMYQLIAEEFSREDLIVRGRLRAALLLGLAGGAACMCVLAIWS